MDSLAYWVFSDIFEEKGAGFGIFHGGFGLVTTNGIPKPTWHAYRFLNALGGELIGRSEEVFFTRRKDGKLSGIIWNYPEAEVPLAAPVCRDPKEAIDVVNTGSAKNVDIEISGFAPYARFQVETLSREYGDAAIAFYEMGSPLEPTRSEEEYLRNISRPAVHMWTADENGVLRIKGTIPAWEIRLIQEL